MSNSNNQNIWIKNISQIIKNSDNQKDKNNMKIIRKISITNIQNIMHRLYEMEEIN